MKLKSMQTISNLFSFIIGILGLVLIFIGFKLPSVIISISIILLFIGALFEFMVTKKLKDLVYPLIIIYLFLGMPFICKFINNKVIISIIALLSFAVIMTFLYREFETINKKKNIPH